MKSPSHQLAYPAAVVAWALCSYPVAAQPIEGLSEGQTMALIGTTLLVIFCGVSGYFLYSGFKNRRLAKASELWPTTGGKVLAAEVSKRTSRDRKKGTTSTYYTPNVRYAYAVADQNYESTVVRFGSLESGNYKEAEEVVARYPAGTTIAVRYDPTDPNRATLETASAAGQQILMGIAFIVAPILILAVMAVIFAFDGDQPDLDPLQP